MKSWITWKRHLVSCNPINGTAGASCNTMARIFRCYLSARSPQEGDGRLYSDCYTTKGN